MAVPDTVGRAVGTPSHPRSAPGELACPLSPELPEGCSSIWCRLVRLQEGRGRGGGGGGGSRSLTAPAVLCSPVPGLARLPGCRWAFVTHDPRSPSDDTFTASRVGLLPAQQPWSLTGGWLGFASSCAGADGLGGHHLQPWDAHPDGPPDGWVMGADQDPLCQCSVWEHRGRDGTWPGPSTAGLGASPAPSPPTAPALPAQGPGSRQPAHGDKCLKNILY